MLDSHQNNTSGSFADYDEESSSVVVPVAGIILSILLVLGVYGNIAVAVVTYRMTTNGSVAGMLQLNLAISDLLTNLLDMPIFFSTLVTGKLQLNSNGCNIFAYISVLLNIASALNVASLSIDRYLAILRPLEYNRRITMRTAATMVLSIWIISGFCSLLPFLGVGQYRFIPAAYHCLPDWTYTAGLLFICLIVCAAFIIPAITMCYCNYSIFQVARRHIRPPNNQEHSHLPTTRFPAKRMWFAAAVFMISWSPYYTVSLYVYTIPYIDPTLSVTITIVTFTSYLSSVINPYIYSFLNRKIWTTFRRFVRRRCCFTIQPRKSSVIFLTTSRSRTSAKNPPHRILQLVEEHSTQVRSECNESVPAHRPKKRSEMRVHPVRNECYVHTHPAPGNEWDVHMHPMRNKSGVHVHKNSITQCNVYEHAAHRQCDVDRIPVQIECDAPTLPTYDVGKRYTVTSHYHPFAPTSSEIECTIRRSSICKVEMQAIAITDRESFVRFERALSEDEDDAEKQSHQQLIVTSDCLGRRCPGHIEELTRVRIGLDNQENRASRHRHSMPYPIYRNRSRMVKAISYPENTSSIRLARLRQQLKELRKKRGYDVCAICNHDTQHDLKRSRRCHESSASNI
ncbi:histamine H2 receptor-like [Anneissia japonica]|uniref:histamine H2 receptor-like n=1 Tax=Anneissia japonica TaxID=1529436 RepID=UPI0014256C1E|nr:histamine H2 receptor-like [Anneissia japonica]